jgi:hypothetical protein
MNFDSQEVNKMSPVEASPKFLSWVDATTLTAVVSHSLDISHFIKLIPVEERPKGLPFTLTGVSASIMIDTETGKTSVISDTNVTYEKAFPDFPTLLTALSVYSTIRDLYDTDHIGFGAAISLYIRQLAIWAEQYNWPAIVAYFVAHVPKHQADANPRNWFEVDMQIFSTHLTRDVITLTVVSKTPSSSISPMATVCKNWNSESGCTWIGCQRKHICSCCGGSHTITHCPTPTPTSKPTA